jgi:hypothetical protein
VLEPNLLHQEEVVRFVLSQYGRAGDGFVEEDATV